MGVCDQDLVKVTVETRLLTRKTTATPGPITERALTQRTGHLPPTVLLERSEAHRISAAATATTTALSATYRRDWPSTGAV